MGFVVFFFVVWLVVSIFSLIKKKLSIIENTFVFLIILILSINFSWIVIEEWKLISLSKKGFEYTGYLLNRSVILPMLILIQLNLLQFSKTTVMKITIFILSVIVLTFLSVLSNFLNITHFKNWHYGYDAIYYFILNLMAIFSYKLFARVSRKGVNYS